MPAVHPRMPSWPTCSTGWETRDATTLIQIANEPSGDFEIWIRDRKNRRAIPHRLEACGYVPVRNEAANDGLWKINGKRAGDLRQG